LNHQSRHASENSHPVILVVEDEFLVRFVIADALRDRDVRVVECASGEEAWEYVQSGARIDLVFTDVRMPGTVDGLELANRIRRTAPGIPIVITSGHLVGVREQTALRFVPKPYNLEETAAFLATTAANAKKSREDND
jgi:CheY-like chemotaxis protein